MPEAVDPATLTQAMINVREMARDDQHAAQALAHLHGQVAQAAPPIQSPKAPQPLPKPVQSHEEPKPKEQTELPKQNADKQPDGKRQEPDPYDRTAVRQRILRWENFFRSKSKTNKEFGHIAEWLRDARKHIDQVGVEAALRSMPEERPGRRGHQVSYGIGADPEQIHNFVTGYLARHGVKHLSEGLAPADLRLISSIAATSDDVGIKGRGRKDDVFPKVSRLDKLEEAKLLPGLEKSEDIHKLMGRKVTAMTPEVIAKLDATYGKDGWIVKPYKDTEGAYGGAHILFPERLQELPNEARNFLQRDKLKPFLGRLQVDLMRDPHTGQYLGVRSQTDGTFFKFGTPDYDRAVERIKKGDNSLGRFLENLQTAARNAQVATLPPGISFMAQPALPPPSNLTPEELKELKTARATGYTYHGIGEARVHIITRNDKAEVVPYATSIKGERYPAVFHSPEHKAMEKVALDAVNGLPESERQGQFYAPDVTPSGEGYGVVELNPANETGASGRLANGPFDIDAYVSHMLGKDPEHVKFIRRLLGMKRSEEKSLRRQIYKATGHYQPRKDLATAPVAAGLAVVADDTGRLLLLQRQLDGSDPNSGRWEFPGGRCDGGKPLATALREWQEEVGLDLPKGRHDSSWTSNDGKYRGFVYRVPREADVPIHHERRPDGDPESGGWAAVAWVDPRDLPHHNLRPALLNDVDNVLAQVVKHLTQMMRVIEKSGGRS